MLKFQTWKKILTVPYGNTAAPKEKMGERKVKAYYSLNGLWAIHRPLGSDKSGFHLTHVPTGYNVNGGGKFYSIEDATKVATKLNRLGDWKTITPDKITYEFGMKCREIIKRHLV